MPNDTRDRNKNFDKSDIFSYASQYAQAVYLALSEIKNLDKAYELLVSSKRIFVAGNGGSAAISDHLCCDWQKGTDSPLKTPLTVKSLVGSVAMFSAIANDLGYYQTFSYQLRREVNQGDLVVLISSSGNSPNILEAVSTAHEFGAKVIGLTGFDGGALKKQADVSLHVPVENYGVVEDCHQSIMHILAQFFYLKNK